MIHLHDTFTAYVYQHPLLDMAGDEVQDKVRFARLDIAHTHILKSQGDPAFEYPFYPVYSIQSYKKAAARKRL